jgi:hypothetical protein
MSPRRAVRRAPSWNRYTERERCCLGPTVGAKAEDGEGEGSATVAPLSRCLLFDFAADVGQTLILLHDHLISASESHRVLTSIHKSGANAAISYT